MVLFYVPRDLTRRFLLRGVIAFAGSGRKTVVNENAERTN